MIHTYASQAHYAEHIAPILDALPPEARGGRFAPRSGSAWGERGKMPTDGLWLVAGYSDARALGAARRIVYLEHGAGQTYPGDVRSVGHGAFSGGAGLSNVALFLCPSETVADRWRANYPDVPAVAVGVPKLDALHTAGPRPRSVGQQTVAFTFHHQGGLCPETSWSLPFYRDHLRGTIDALRGSGCVVIGHGHPRAETPLRRLWSDLGVEWVPTLAEVFDRADCLVADNTSAAPEAASVGIPLVWLNVPWYRRDVEHGGRFWAWPQGQVQVDHPDDLVEGIVLALADPPQIRDARQRMVHTVYAHCDGHAAARAAKAIIGLG